MGQVEEAAAVAEFVVVAVEEAVGMAGVVGPRG